MRRDIGPSSANCGITSNPLPASAQAIWNTIQQKHFHSCGVTKKTK
jgi:hypothetical protein